jgi:DNA-binding PadR family transcriptional regulator
VERSDPAVCAGSNNKEGKGEMTKTPISLHGTVYLCLIRLVQKKWITAKWGVSENNRRAKFYSISNAGRKQLSVEAESWQLVSGVIGRMLQLATRR